MVEDAFVFQQGDQGGHGLDVPSIHVRTDLDLHTSVEHEVAHGTTHQTVYFPEVKAFNVLTPPIDEQRRIVRVLAALDDKIESNRRIASTLEAMAAALFRARFVDFVGCNELVESEIGPIPRSWELVELGRFVTATKGRSYRRADLKPGDTALLTLKSVRRGGGYFADGVKPFAGDYRPEQVVQPGEVILACTDLTQAAEVIGRPARVQVTPPYKTLVASLDLAVVRPIDGHFPSSFLLGLLGSNRFHEHARSHANGSTVLHLSNRAVPDFTFPLPPMRDILSFASAADPLFALIDKVAEMNRRLEQIRDGLLPKLVSGQVRVPEGAFGTT